ncbi:MAG: hypothetical protein ACOC7N_05555, partial [Chloroflexota bacterium]
MAVWLALATRWDRPPAFSPLITSSPMLLSAIRVHGRRASSANAEPTRRPSHRPVLRRALLLVTSRLGGGIDALRLLWDLPDHAFHQ